MDDNWRYPRDLGNLHMIWRWVKTLVPSEPQIAGKWMFIPLKMVLYNRYWSIPISKISAFPPECSSLLPWRSLEGPTFNMAEAKRVSHHGHRHHDRNNAMILQFQILSPSIWYWSWYCYVHHDYQHHIISTNVIILLLLAISQYGFVWKCCVPHCTQWFCWSLSRF